ncbi:S24 family peptidase [Marinifilum fragile]|uniref:S24 family peptidase n=1 Tax=Marinifilum fragile TaxID=570161 RepID=UPI0006D1AAF2|nr:S24 family peptidase [Marinifilum fragile]
MSHNNNDYSQRFELIITKLGYSPLAFSRLLGYSRADKIYNVLNAKNKPSFDILSDITRKFECVNIEWLLTGSGEPFKSKSIVKGRDEINYQKENDKSEKQFVIPKCITVDSNEKENILMLDVRASAGYPENIDNAQYLEQQPAFSIPRPEFQGATFRGFQVSGDSMEPTLTNSSWVFAMAVDDAEFIKDGLVYVVVLKSGVVVKRVLNRLKERKQLILKSDNTSYPIKTINQEDILEVWAVKSYMSFDLGNHSANLYQMINNLEIKQLDFENKIERLTTIIENFENNS